MKRTPHAESGRLEMGKWIVVAGIAVALPLMAGRSGLPCREDFDCDLNRSDRHHSDSSGESSPTSSLRPSGVFLVLFRSRQVQLYAEAALLTDRIERGRKCLE